MKTLTAILVVLVTASLANAALVVTITGPTLLAPGATGTFTISYTGLEILGADVDVVANYGTQPFGIHNGKIIPSNADWALNVTGINGATGNYELACIDDISNQDLGGTLFTFDWTVPTDYWGIITISMIENSFIDLNYEVLGIDNSEQVILESFPIFPEPMTLALLALGGLFIRRK